MVIAKTHFNYIAPDEYARRDKASGIWARDPHDWYVESEWCSERLFATEIFSGNVIDPACGFGRIVVSARKHYHLAEGMDIVRRSAICGGVADFFDPDWRGCKTATVRFPNIVSNPPFGRADEFVALALERAFGRVAMILPATWHFGSKRAAWLATTPLRKVLALTPRPSMPPGAVIAAGEKPGGGAKDFSWYIWEIGYSGPWEGGWLHRDPPCRRRLERDNDYPATETTAS